MISAKKLATTGFTLGVIALIWHSLVMMVYDVVGWMHVYPNIQLIAAVDYISAGIILLLVFVGAFIGLIVLMRAPKEKPGVVFIAMALGSIAIAFIELLSNGLYLFSFTIQALLFLHII